MAINAVVCMWVAQWLDSLLHNEKFVGFIIIIVQFLTCYVSVG